MPEATFTWNYRITLEQVLSETSIIMQGLQYYQGLVGPFT